MKRLALITPVLTILAVVPALVSAQTRQTDITAEDIFALVEKGNITTATKTERPLKMAPQAVTVITRHFVPAFDTVDYAIAKSVMEKLLDKSTYPNLIEHVTLLEIDKKGNCRCKMRQKIRAGQDGLYFTSHFMEGDVAQPTFDTLELQLRTFAPEQFAWWMPINDTPKAKSILVAYDPPVQKGECVDVEVSWRWPGIFRRIANNQSDIWDENIFASTALDRFRVDFRLHPSLPKVTIRPSGQTGGKQVSVRELAADQDGNRRYVCDANGISGRSKLALHLQPHDNS